MKGGQSKSGFKFPLASEINCVLSSENMHAIHTSRVTSIDVIIEEDGVIFFQLQFHYLIRLLEVSFISSTRTTQILEHHIEP